MKRRNSTLLGLFQNISKYLRKLHFRLLTWLQSSLTIIPWGHLPGISWSVWEIHVVAAVAPLPNGLYTIFPRQSSLAKSKSKVTSHTGVKSKDPGSQENIKYARWCRTITGSANLSESEIWGISSYLLVSDSASPFAGWETGVYWFVLEQKISVH